MQRWKKAGERLTWRPKLPRRNRRAPRQRPRPTRPLKGSRSRRWTVHLRSPKWLRSQPLVRLLPPASCPLSQARGRDWWRGEEPVAKKPPILLREDSQYALKQISSIINDEDYEDLGNHATEAMRETGLFSFIQACIRPLFFIYSFCLFFILTRFLFL